jgi:hypothetical protein
LLTVQDASGSSGRHLQVSGNSVALRDSSCSRLSQHLFLQGADEIAIESLRDVLEVLRAGASGRRRGFQTPKHFPSEAVTELF